MQPIGDRLDAMGIRAEIEDSDLIASAVVILAILSEGDSTPQLYIANSDGMGWIEQAGLVRLAERITSDPAAEEA
jgi:hypothetical protein